jgi:hypothetical protein
LRTPEGKQAVLSLLAYWRGIRAPGTPDLSTITNALTVEYPESLASFIIAQFPNKWKISMNSLSAVNHFYKTTFGPNGKAVYTALSDLKALQQDSNLLETLIGILQILGELSPEGESFLEGLEELLDQMDCDELPEDCYHSRLAVKQEMGGKDRVFAIVDYWTQATLRPLHQTVAKLLRNIPQDATFGQDTAAETIKNWTKDSTPLYSYDLSAATDRVPAALQKAVVGKMTGSPEFANLWLSLMTHRDFKFRSKNGIRYAVGQPMGAYSSWPIFALTHHLIVMAAAKRAGINQPEYRILGDDIVLRSKPLAQHYLIIMKSFGVEISLSKSVTGNVAEFAKRLFTRGKEVTPIPVRLITAFLKDFRLIRELRDHLLLRGAKGQTHFFSVQTRLHHLISVLPHHRQAKARILLALPSLVVEGFDLPLNREGKVDNSIYYSDNSEWQKCLTFTRYKYLVERYSLEVQNASKLEQQVNLPAKLKSLGFQGELRGLDTQLWDLHPIAQAISRRKSDIGKAHRALGKYWTALTQEGPTAIRPNVSMPDLKALNPSHRKQIKYEADILLLAHSRYLEWLVVKETVPEATFSAFWAKKYGLRG